MTTQDAFTDRLSEYLDGELAPRDRAEMERHLEACDICRATLADLRVVVARASALADSAPAVDLWPAVAERISPGAGVVPMRPTAPRRFSFTFSFTLPQLAAAVLAIAVLSAGALWLARLGGERTDFPPIDARVQQAAAGAATEFRPANFADAAYDEAIADLRQMLEAGRTRLDAETLRVLEANLGAIDEAIAQCRDALAADPANAYLNSHLANAKKRKLALLRRASALAHTEG